MVVIDDVLIELGPQAPPAGDARLVRAVEAVNDYLSQRRPDIEQPWPADFADAAVTLAARRWLRMEGAGSPQYDDGGLAASLPVLDWDLMDRLGLGRYHKPVVA